ncbi:MAG TPA: NADH-quinone oxidoreductase subunit J [Baekduia sp.]|uniref:NADH-quinone oxidoreductase subunit J family protein n=1 Tax=Baekduia sp. TaxID=2600305 RepID=UPI002C7BC57D|nr:NADH-quinone oxidoreductase subunit J [Baekduia sp.]HMJ33905.1 NADH-quinone oxidoreductase subunit J [Baekduia sp.]
MAPVFFFIASIAAIAGAIGVATLRNPFYSVLALVSHLVALAALFLLLRAEFIAAAQVVVYAGAVMVLYVFVVAYVGGQAEPVRPAGGPGLRIGSILFSGALAVELLIAVLGSGLKAIDSQGAPYSPGFGTPASIGELLLTRFLFPFEAASILLLMAAVGAVVLARRRGGLEGADEVEVARIDVRLPEGTGSMKEGVGDINPTGHIDPHALLTPAAGQPTPEERR